MAQHVVPVKVYFLIFSALMVLTATTVAVAFVDLGPLNAVLMIGIAMIKALLVVLYFMHVRYSGTLIACFAGGSVVWLLILLALTLSDYLTRAWHPSPAI